MINQIISRNIRYLFGTQSINIRILDKDPISNARIDKHLDRYGHLIRAFILKRRINRSQIWPKIHIIDDIPSQQIPHLSYQSLFSMKKSMKDEVLKVISLNDPQKINSGFIISIFCQDYFKQMMDQYLNKILICGKCPNNNQQYIKIENKVKQLYNIFYFGEKNTLLQRQIQQIYLSSKQYKYRRSEVQNKLKKQNYQYCIWTQQDQRILEQKQNWLTSDNNLTDINYKTYFQPLQYSNRVQYRLKLQKLLKNWTFLDQIKFNLFTKKHYDPTTRYYYQWIQQKLFIRIMNHLRSLEFKTCLNIPHDYMIEAQMIQIHFWLVINRLNKIATTSSRILAKKLELTLNLQIIRSSRSVNLKKSNVLQTSFEKMLQTNKTMLELHFERSPITKNNHYKGIDALVWSLAFAQKVHRYSDQIYLFSEYLIKNYEHMEHHTYNDLINGIIQFDPYLVDHRYRQIIQKVNPPLDPAQFQRQFNSNSNKKDYYYSKIQRQMDQQLARSNISKSSNKINTKFTFSQLIQPIRNVLVKYLTLKTFDHYSKMQEEKKRNEQLDKKGTWRSQNDEVKQIHENFNNIQNIKNKRKSKNIQQSQNK